MTPAEKRKVRREVAAIMTRLVLRGQRPDPATFSPELQRAVQACGTGEDVLALVVHCVHGLPVVGPRIAAYLAEKRDEVLAEVVPRLRLLKGGNDADAA